MGVRSIVPYEEMVELLASVLVSEFEGISFWSSDSEVVVAVVEVEVVVVGVICAVQLAVGGAPSALYLG